MARIKGMTVTLVTNEQVGTDPFGAPIYEPIRIAVDNVIVAPSSADDVVSAQNLTGRKAIYTLGIPKGDTNQWENQKVEFFGETWRVFGIPLQGQEEMIPLSWNKKVMVERYE